MASNPTTPQTDPYIYFSPTKSSQNAIKFNTTSSSAMGSRKSLPLKMSPCPSTPPSLEVDSQDSTPPIKSSSRAGRTSSQVSMSDADSHPPSSPRASASSQDSQNGDYLGSSDHDSVDDERSIVDLPEDVDGSQSDRSERSRSAGSSNMSGRAMSPMLDSNNSSNKSKSTPITPVATTVMLLKQEQDQDDESSNVESHPTSTQSTPNPLTIPELPVTPAQRRMNTHLAALASHENLILNARNDLFVQNRTLTTISAPLVTIVQKLEVSKVRIQEWQKQIRESRQVMDDLLEDKKNLDRGVRAQVEIRDEAEWRVNDLVGHEDRMKARLKILEREVALEEEFKDPTIRWVADRAGWGSDGVGDEERRLQGDHAWDGADNGGDDDDNDSPNLKNDELSSHVFEMLQTFAADDGASGLSHQALGKLVADLPRLDRKIKQEPEDEVQASKTTTLDAVESQQASTESSGPDVPTGDSLQRKVVAAYEANRALRMEVQKMMPQGAKRKREVDESEQGIQVVSGQNGGQMRAEIKSGNVVRKVGRPRSGKWH